MALLTRCVRKYELHQGLHRRRRGIRARRAGEEDPCAGKRRHNLPDSQKSWSCFYLTQNIISVYLGRRGRGPQHSAQDTGGHGE